VLVNIFGKSYEDVFTEFEEHTMPGDKKGGGDVKYHLGRSADIVTAEGKEVHLSLVPNPSHLEAVNPVVQGIVYSKQLELSEGNNKKIVPILVHGDSAVSGQGVNYEVTNLSKLEGFSTGGTVHIVLNNQVGFTANYKESRSSVYSTDLAKVTESPVFHVNADDPESVVLAVKMAIKIRQIFAIDVYVDIVGYRRYGHNEGDEPRFTQPMLYSVISKHPNIHQVFMKRLIEDNTISQNDALEMMTQLKDRLQSRLQLAREKQRNVKADYLQRFWGGLRESEDKDFDQSRVTGVAKPTLDQIATALVTPPSNFTIFSKMEKLLKNRSNAFFEENRVDWAMAELLAYGSLLIQNHPVRLTGQDSQRGTFSHRHAVIKDTANETHYVPLNHILEKQAMFQVYNSALSEYCAMGFEFGYSMARPQSLVIWEAQFGDFANGAQIIIDQFLSSSESKWFRMSGLVLMLPHGYEGQGPEHSNARPERFLQLCAQNNMYVVNLTTPANLFHVLRRQIENKFRKPMVIFSPKSLLRHPKVISSVSELASGRFKEVIDDEGADPSKIKRVVICWGKIYYELLDQKEKIKDKKVALVRVEQLYPLPFKQLNALKKKYKNAQWVWTQEEPANMGGWSHVLRHLRGFELGLNSRDESASPATGSSKVHIKTQKIIIEEAFKLK
jgi:2-oxoglutarate dehydrogenase E1 component